MTRTAKIHAKIEAKNLTINTGNDFYDYNTKELTSNNTNANTKPINSIEIDSSLLGGVHAGRITIKSNEHGVGINLNNKISSTDDMEITADGKVVYKELEANNKIKLTSNSNSITGTKSLYSKYDNIEIEAKKGKFATINNGNSIQTGNSLIINTDSTEFNKTSITTNKSTSITTNNHISLQRKQNKCQ